MDWQGLLRKVSSEHPHNHHVLSRCEVAIASAKEALQTLAAHGYIFHLAEGLGEPYPSWPRKLFHVDTAPNGRTVFCEQDALELGPGWFDSFQRAQFWDGLETQFNGRGGVPKSPRPPARIYAPITLSAEEVERMEALKQQIAAFRAANKWETPDESKASSAAEGSEGQQELRSSGESPQSSEESSEQIAESAEARALRPNSSVPLESKPEVVTLRDSGAAAERVA